MTARSTIAGTPVRSWRIDPRRHERDLGLGRARPAATTASVSTSSARTIPPPAWRSAFSSRILTVTGAAVEVDPVGQDGQPVVVRQAGAERAPGAEGIDAGNACGPRWLATLDAWKRTATAPADAAAGR